MNFQGARSLWAALAIAAVAVAGGAASASAGNAPGAVRPTSAPSSAGRAAAALRVSIQGRGTVTSSPAGITCSDTQTAQCTGTFATGSAVALTAVPSQDWAFWGWTGACTGSQNPCAVSLRTDASVQAIFIGVDVLSTSFTARWRKSVLIGGAATIQAAASHEAELDMTLRFPNGRTQAQHFSVPAPGGRFTARLTFRGARGIFPGRGYLVIFSGTVLGKPYQRTVGLSGLPGPPEGVVRRAFTSSPVNFTPRTRFPPLTTGILAHFVFASLPRRSARITTTWYINGRPIGKPAKKARQRTVRTLIVVPGGRLPSARYRCVLRAGGKVVAETNARVG